MASNAAMAHRGAAVALREEALLDLVVEAEQLLQKAGHAGRCKLEASRLLHGAVSQSAKPAHAQRRRAGRTTTGLSFTTRSAAAAATAAAVLPARRENARVSTLKTRPARPPRAVDGFVGRLVVGDDLAEALAAVVAAVAAKQHAQLCALHVGRVRAARRRERLARQRPLRHARVRLGGMQPLRSGHAPRSARRSAELSGTALPWPVRQPPLARSRQMHAQRAAHVP